MTQSCRESRRKPPRLAAVLAGNGAPLYFVTFCTWERRPLLACHDAHQAFLTAAGKIEMAGNAVGRYVIMPDHVHVFLRIGIDGKLSMAVKCLRESMTKALRKQNPTLRVWQPGFFDHLMRSSESYAAKWDYVRQNPVRKGLAAGSELWPFEGEIVSIPM